MATPAGAHGVPSTGRGKDLMRDPDPAPAGDVARAVGGEAGAFDRLFAACEAEVRRILAAQLRGKSDSDVDEAVQDVRIYVYDKLAIYDPVYPFVVFVRGLTRTIGKRHRSTRGSRHEVPLDSVREPADRPPAAEPSPLFLEMLELFLREGGYPHQQVAFGFSVLVFGRVKKPTAGAATRKGEITGNPERVVDEVGPRKLTQATHDLLLDIRVLAHVDADFLAQAATELHARLDLSVEDLFRGDGRSKRVFSELLQRQVGETRLEEYFGRDPRKSVSDWTHTVKVRVQRAVAGKSSPGES